MIRRTLRALPSLTKSLSRVTVLGGSQDNGEYCFGYGQDKDGLKVCPAPDGQCANNVTADNFYSADRHINFGLTLLLYTNGVAVALEKGENPYNFTRLSEGAPFSVEARTENGDNLLVVVCGNQMCVYDGATEEKSVIALPYSIYGGVVHCGRLFAVDKSDGCKVVWSGLRVTEWEDGVQGSGYVLLDGDLGNVLKLENFGDDILCVRERGFTIMHALGDSRNFRIAPSQCAVKTGEEVCVGGAIGKKYYFASGGGLYCFDGDSIALAYAVDDNFTLCNKAYVYGDGYVYADCVYGGKQCLMRYEPASGKAVFFGADCSSPFVVDGELYCSKDYCFFRLSAANAEEGRLWRSKPIGGCGRKVLKNLWVEADGAPEITVICGDTSRKFSGTGKIPVNSSGECIIVEIRGHAAVKSVVAELEVRK
ncbi:MAG: hypothetical protein ACI4QN_00570 [Candidatus Coproplasma sp.]